MSLKETIMTTEKQTKKVTKVKARKRGNLIKKKIMDFEKLRSVKLDKLPFVSKNITDREKLIVAMRGLGATYKEIAEKASVSERDIKEVIYRYSDDVENIKVNSVTEVIDYFGVSKQKRLMFNTVLLNEALVELQKRQEEGSLFEGLKTKELLSVASNLEKQLDSFRQKSKIKTGHYSNPLEGSGIKEEKDADI